MGAIARRADDYSVKEAAVLSGLSEKALRNEVDRGVIRPRERCGTAQRRDRAWSTRLWGPSASTA
jgi:hypothetical protein